MAKHTLLLLGLIPLLAAAGNGTNANFSKTVPPFVQQMAEDFYLSLTASNRFETQSVFTNRFADAFLDGFNSGTGSIWSRRHGAYWHGYKAGFSYKQDHEDQLDPLMTGYGYKKTECTGVWSFGFEVSGFVPESDEWGPRDWWLGSLGATWPKTTNMDYLIQSMKLRISGYLSPRGKYGHLGMYDREFLATEITPMVSDQN